MAQENFDRCLELVLRHEGGFVDHPDDPGGATNQGITQATYDRWRRSRGLSPRSVRSLKRDERDAIYREDYWRPAGGEDLRVGLDYATFDGAVNSGVSRGVKWLQAAVGAKEDGKFGPETLAATQAVKDVVAVIKDMIRRRTSFLQSLKHWKTFGKGWTRRVVEVEADACAMAAVSEEQARRRADYEAEKAKKSAKGQEAGGAASGAGGVGSGAGAAETEPAIEIDPSGVPEWLWPWLLGAAAVGLLGLAVWLLYRSYINKARARAHAAVAMRKGAVHA